MTDLRDFNSPPHILNLVTDPHNTSRLNNSAITKLEKLTIDSINQIQENDGFWQRCLNELFIVAKLQEGYKSGQIGNDKHTILQITGIYTIWMGRL